MRNAKGFTSQALEEHVGALTLKIDDLGGNDSTTRIWVELTVGSLFCIQERGSPACPAPIRHPTGGRRNRSFYVKRLVVQSGLRLVD